MARTGVFGGTFDPPHVGHLIVAQDVVEKLALDRLLMIPAAEPPNKPEPPRAAAELRARMLDAAVGEHPKLELSRIELERGGTSYTVDTLEALGARSPKDQLFLLIGVDQLRSFASWRAPARVASLARLVVMSRDGADPDAPPPGLDVSFESVVVPRVDVSSTEIRRRIGEGRSVRYWVPDAVLEIIRDEKLYGIG
jgi:nicotinate-nucleotide adenylyltransferase